MPCTTLPTMASDETPLRFLLIIDETVALDYLALSYREQGRYIEAEQLLKRSLLIRKKAFGPEHPAVALSLENYASQLRETGRDAKAAGLEARAQAIHAKNVEKVPFSPIPG